MNTVLLFLRKVKVKLLNKMLDNLKFFLREFKHKYIYERPSKSFEIDYIQIDYR